MIDFGRPFQHAFEHTTRVLFRPFNIGKWFTLGFTAWLASFLSGGNSGSFNFPGNNYSPSSNSGVSSGLSKAGTEMVDKMLGMGLPFWLMILALAALLFCLLVFIFIILGCRGQFMFLDNVIHNRDEVVKPWKEFSKEANSLTIWHTILSLLPLILIFGFLGFALAHFWTDLLTRTTRTFTAYLPWILGFTGLILLLLPVGIFAFLLHEFGVPIMAKHRCTVSKACGHLWHLLRTRFLDCLVFMFIRFCMGIAFIVLSLMTCCLTCCLGMLPYLNTVVTLPYHVFRQTYTLDCLAQFGPDYDLWPVIPPPPFPPSGSSSSF
jgi:hypothetical protein